MFEELLEECAQKNALREVNTSLKLATGLGALLLALLSTSYVAPLFIALVIATALLFLARIPPRTLGALYAAPFSFAALSVAAIILLTGGSGVIWSWQPLAWFGLSLTTTSINLGVYVLCRAIGGMSALFFLALTTPMTDLFQVMRRVGLPSFLVELIMIVYQTTFILLDHLVQCYQAQVMRLGYSRFQESIRSFATLAGATFIMSWNSGEDLIRAREMRCYDGRLVILGESRAPELRPTLAVGVFLGIATLITILTRAVTLL